MMLLEGTCERIRKKERKQRKKEKKQEWNYEK